MAGSSPLPPDHSGVLLHRGFQQPLQDGPFPHRCASGGSRQRLGSTGHVPASGPSPGRTSRLGAKCPPIKESNKILKNSRFPLSLLLYLKQGKWGRKPKRVQLMGSWRGPESGHEPRAPSGGQVWSRGMAGRGAGRSGGGRVQVRELSRPSEVFERHSLPGVRGRGKVRAPIPAPGTSAGTGRSRAAACEAGAERAEPVAGLGNPRPPPLIRL